MAQRVTLRKRTPYNTTSNRRRVVKTPGGKLVYHHLKKPASGPKCGDCGVGLPGVGLNHTITKTNAYVISCLCARIDSCPPTSPVCHHLQTSEDYLPCVRRLTVWLLCEVTVSISSNLHVQQVPTISQYPPCVPGGGGEDCEEGHQVAAEDCPKINDLSTIVSHHRWYIAAFALFYDLYAT